MAPCLVLPSQAHSFAVPHKPYRPIGTPDINLNARSHVDARIHALQKRKDREEEKTARPSEFPYREVTAKSRKIRNAIETHGRRLSLLNDGSTPSGAQTRLKLLSSISKTNGHIKSNPFRGKARNRRTAKDIQIAPQRISTRVADTSSSNGFSELKRHLRESEARVRLIKRGGPRSELVAAGMVFSFLVL